MNIVIEMKNIQGYCWCDQKDCPVMFFKKKNKVCPGCWRPGAFEVREFTYTLKEIR